MTDGRAAASKANTQRMRNLQRGDDRDGEHAHRQENAQRAVVVVAEPIDVIAVRTLRFLAAQNRSSPMVFSDAGKSWKANRYACKPLMKC